MSELAGTVLGRCRLGPVIGQGSMGVVYEGMHLTLNIPVAVKILREPAFGEDAFRYRERFRREARLAARLNHPGLVRVLDFGEEGDLPYLVMELVRGQTLDQILRTSSWTATRASRSRISDWRASMRVRASRWPPGSWEPPTTWLPNPGNRAGIRIRDRTCIPWA